MKRACCDQNSCSPGLLAGFFRHSPTDPAIGEVKMKANGTRHQSGKTGNAC
jgi:hypothetical protein